MFRDLKYLLAYITPIFAYAGMEMGGIWSFGAAYWAFILIPLIELFVPASAKNETEEFYKKRLSWFFDLLLYSNVLIVYFLLFQSFQLWSTPLTSLESIGLIINMGVVLGSLGINVAHELGHRDTIYEKIMAWMLLLPSSYLHFYIEHNLGHHKHVGTPEDPSTARLGESIYAFWFRSFRMTYIGAWRIETKRVSQSSWWKNKMIYFTAIQFVYWLAIFLLFSWQVLVFAVIVGLVGALLLESVNYIEHYGLLRSKKSNDRYEAVQTKHSWNSNHELGRIVLYELVRHSDHHTKSTRKYQNLRSVDNSPQLPSGYPGMILLAHIPFLWFRIMNKRIPSNAQIVK